MSIFEKPPLDEALLEHYGVKGMHWGVRKKRDSSPAPSIQNKGVQISRDGSVSIKPGASIQRLVTSDSFSRPMKDITYVSINDYDNSKYIKVIGGKGFLGGGRDTILSIKATKPIKAPSVEESTKVVSNLLLNDAAFRRKNTDLLGRQIGKRELEKIRQDPSGKTARKWYDMTNQKMVFDKEFDPDAPFIQKKVRQEFESKGFNALRDENDAQVGISKSPLIIFSPEKSLKVVTVTQITDEVRKANKQKLREYRRNGKAWIDQQIYS